MGGYRVVDYVLVDERGEEREVTPEVKKEYPEVAAVIRDEEGEKIEGEPAHIRLSHQLRIAEREPLSDAGCVRWLPNGAFMYEAIRRYIWDSLFSLDYTYPIVSPTIVNEEDRRVRWLIDNFPERHYRVLPGKEEKEKKLFLRTAGDYMVFSLHSDTTKSYRHLPIGLVENENDFRYEQRGELRGLHRLREFHMQNIHTVCRDVEEGWKVFNDMWRRIEGLFQKLFGGSDIFVFYTKKEFYERVKEDVKGWAAEYGKRVLVVLVSELHLYMGAWIDLVVIDSLGRPIEAGTAQLDTLSADPWHITYVDENGKEREAVIVHAGFGYERVVAALLEKSAREGRKTLPLWISPVQVRVIPVSMDNLAYAVSFAEKLNELGVRADVDDTESTLAKKVRNAHREWIRYIAVVGSEEERAGGAMVTDRERDEKRFMKAEEIAERVRAEDPVRMSRVGPIQVSRKPRFGE